MSHQSVGRIFVNSAFKVVSTGGDVQQLDAASRLNLVSSVMYIVSAKYWWRDGGSPGVEFGRFRLIEGGTCHQKKYGKAHLGGFEFQASSF